ncbi:MAG: hypothetical protein A2Z95_08545 [Gallionellales bacterium GWA2_60_18]|nr:MAG: hypothetical protein A2Z95_08545 [Gallionellales bacterium GWA2_60_18]
MGVIAYFAYLAYLGHMAEKESNEYMSYMRSVMMIQDINNRIGQHNIGNATKENRPDWVPQHFTLKDELSFLSKILDTHQKATTDYEKAPHPYGEKLNDSLAVPLQATLTVLVSGYVLMVGGFLAWYKKAQSPQDELAKLEIELKKSLLAKTKAEIKQLSRSRFAPPK